MRRFLRIPVAQPQPQQQVYTQQHAPISHVAPVPVAGVPQYVSYPEEYYQGEADCSYSDAQAYGPLTGNVIPQQGFQRAPPGQYDDRVQRHAPGYFESDQRRAGEPPPKRADDALQFAHDSQAPLPPEHNEEVQKEEVKTFLPVSEESAFTSEGSLPSSSSMSVMEEPSRVQTEPHSQPSPPPPPEVADKPRNNVPAPSPSPEKPPQNTSQPPQTQVLLQPDTQISASPPQSFLPTISGESANQPKVAAQKNNSSEVDSAVDKSQMQQNANSDSDRLHKLSVPYSEMYQTSQTQLAQLYGKPTGPDQQLPEPNALEQIKWMICCCCKSNENNPDFIKPNAPAPPPPTPEIPKEEPAAKPQPPSPENSDRDESPRQAVLRLEFGDNESVEDHGDSTQTDDYDDDGPASDCSDDQDEDYSNEPGSSEIDPSYNDNEDESIDYD
ncbi:hypothetical protein ACOMHN_067371 [Nucella lapillus]